MPEPSAPITQPRQRKVKGGRKRVTMFVTEQQYQELEEYVAKSGGSISSVASHRYTIGCDAYKKLAGITPKLQDLSISFVPPRGIQA